jgi:hypothetical protein
MSPLSKVKELLKGDVDHLKERANQSFFRHLNDKQAMHYEHQLKQKEAIKKAHGSKTAEESIDPIGYYENRYFPYGFDDPSKVLHFHPHHYNAKGEVINEEAAVNPGYLN